MKPAKLMDRGAMSQLSQFRNVMGDMAKGRFKRYATIVGVAAKSSDAFNLQRKIQLPFVFEPRTLAFGQNSENNVPADIQSDGRSVQRREVSIEPDKRRAVRRQVKVRRSLVDRAGKQLNQINLIH